MPTVGKGMSECSAKGHQDSVGWSFGGVAEGASLGKFRTSGEDGMERQSGSATTWYINTADTVATGIPLIGSRLNGHPETRTGVNGTGFLPFLLNTREWSEVPTLSCVPEPVVCQSTLFQ